MGPLAMIDVMCRHQEFSHAVIRAHDGELSQFIGAATMAYWLDGCCAGNHAASAFAAAQRMLAELPSLLTPQGGLKYRFASLWEPEKWQESSSGQRNSFRSRVAAAPSLADLIVYQRLRGRLCACRNTRPVCSMALRPSPIVA